MSKEFRVAVSLKRAWNCRRLLFQVSWYSPKQLFAFHHFFGARVRRWGMANVMTKSQFFLTRFLSSRQHMCSTRNNTIVDAENTTKECKFTVVNLGFDHETKILSPKSTDGHSYKANAQQLEKNVLCNFRHISKSAVREAKAAAKIFQTNTCQQFFNSPNGQ